MALGFAEPLKEMIIRNRGKCFWKVELGGW
jgi:hypothetical protein